METEAAAAGCLSGRRRTEKEESYGCPVEGSERFCLFSPPVRLETGSFTDGLVTDLSELSLPPTIKMDHPDPEDILNFTLTIEPDEGTFPSCPTSPPPISPKACSQLLSRDVQGRVVPLYVRHQQ